MKDNEIKIPPNTVVVLSGLPGSGKSTLRKHALNLPDGAWISSDEIREQLFGAFETLDNEGAPVGERIQLANDAVFSIMRQMVGARSAQGLPSVVDATSLTDAERSGWNELADNMDSSLLVLILDTPVEECARSNARRHFRVPVSAFNRMATTFTDPPAEGQQPFCAYSRHPFKMVSRDTRLCFVPHELPHEKVDVIGDVHGLLQPLLELLVKAGWSLDAHNRPVPPEPGRKLLFLGDLVDRGPQSIEVIEWVANAHEAGVAFSLRGNHEDKLLRFLRRVSARQPVASWRSSANADTGMAFLRLPAERQQRLTRFLRRLPSYYVIEKVAVAFTHANISAFEPMRAPADYLVFGDQQYRCNESDERYQALFDAGQNRYTLFRGHLQGENRYENVFSLEEQAYQLGNLALLRLDGFLADRREGLSGNEAFKKNVIRHATGFNFDEHRQRWRAAREMDSLAARKLVTSNTDETGTLRVFKYSKRVFWDNSWHLSPWLLKARGLVLDAAGNVVSHAFDKCFNYGENGAGKDLPLDTEVIAAVKMNGFLGVCSAHPVLPGELLAHTQGGLGGEFVGYIKEYLQGRTSGLVKRFLHNNDVTLMFEVIHPEDPHIIEYGQQDYGLWLIGVRGKNLDDQPWPEAMVDRAAEEMGLKRAPWERIRVEQLLERCGTQDVSSVEGWMVRTVSPQQQYLFKLKTPFYLTTKFLGRLSTSNIRHMYGHPANFKQKVDEEFYPLVDILVTRFTAEQLTGMSDEERVIKIRGLIKELLQAQP